MNFSFKTIVPIVITLIFTAAMLFAGNLSSQMSLAVTNNSYLNAQFNYQFLLVVISGFSLLSTYLLNKENFKLFFKVGQVSCPAQELKFFGIKQGDSWTKTGLSLCVVITGVTALFMYFQVKQTTVDWPSLSGGLFWILLFSLSNSFGEEMIFRLGLISPLSGLVAPKNLFFISALLFGLPHFAGMPNGIVGATLAGVLGFVLAKAMFETRGFFWAWTIHFLQDIIIIGSLFLMNNSAGSAVD